MNQAVATLHNYRHSPRKVRVVANLLRGKKVEAALSSLLFVDKKATTPLSVLIKSALANAKNLNLDIDNLIVKEITVNAGPIMYRRRPASRGRAHPIRKRTSHVSVVLAEGVKKDKKVKIKMEKNNTKSIPKKTKE